MSSLEARAPDLPLLVSVAFRPRATMRRILEHLGGWREIVPLVIAAFLASVVKSLDTRVFVQASSPWAIAIILGAIAAGIPLVLGLFWVGAWVATLAGRMLEGKADVRAVRAALAWGAAPLCWALLYRVPARLFLNDAYSVLHSESKHSVVEMSSAGLEITGPDFGGAGILPVVVLAVLDILFLVWYLAVASRTLAEAQGFESSWKGLGNLLLMFALPIAAMAAAAIAWIWK